MYSIAEVTKLLVCSGDRKKILIINISRMESKCTNPKVRLF